MRQISGAKGSDSSSSPTESPDSLHSVATARILDIVSEGPIQGLVNGLQSVYLDDTPIQNSDGSTNFTNYTVDYRLGTQDQTFMSGFPAVENEIAVSVALTSDTPWVRQVENTQLTAVRVRIGVPALQQSDATTGDVNGYRIEYAVDLATDGGSYSQVLTGAFDGKTTSLYERTIRIELPAASTGWLVRVRRLTTNAHSALIADTTTIEAITEVIDRKLRYPMSAVFGLSFDAQSFSSVPTRAYDLYLRIISVPSNYDPIARTYSGTWDGTFKQAWSDSPPWIFYDLVLNPVYGLGKRIDASMIDKWGLYDIGRYCDVMVSDGKGGQEPRFTCNAYIQSQADAYKVLQDLASVFRGISYWGPGSVVACADMPSDPVYVYTAANRCADGPFTYVGSALKTRYTVALVSWNDPANGYQQAAEYVSDDDGISRYGVTKAQITAFGTTSQGQAHRLGLWTLLTSRYETNTVSFSVGLDGTRCAPGQIIAVADPDKAGRRIGGRVRTVAGANITLDKAPAAAAGDILTAILPSGIAQARTVQSIAGDTITLAAAYDTAPVNGAVWMLESADLASQLFRVVSVQENSDDGQITYVVNATQYEPGKYAAIDDGAAIQVRPVTVIPPSVQPPPTNVRLSSYSVIDQGISKTTMVIAWDSADKAVSYIPEWQKDNGEWISMNAVGGLQAEVPGIYQGGYVARVRAVNGMGVTSIPAYGVLTQLTGKTSPPPSVASLTTVSQIFGIDVIWTYPADGSAGDTQRTELWYSRTPARADAVKQSDYAYPQAKASLMGLAAGQTFYFWARLVDTSGNIGAWFPIGDPGVQGSSSADATAYNEYFAGLITKSALGQDLLAPIDAIPGMQTDLAANAAAITKEVTDRSSAIASESDARAAAIELEAIARAQSDAAEALARGTAITTEQQSREDADGALSTRIDAVSATTGGNAAAITQEITARTDADSALGSRIDTVVSATSGNTAAITGEATTRADADSALSSRIDTVVSNVGANTSAIQNEATTRADADSALSTRIDTVTASTAANASAISQEATARADADSTQAQLTTALTARVGGLENPGANLLPNSSAASGTAHWNQGGFPGLAWQQAGDGNVFFIPANGTPTTGYAIADSVAVWGGSPYAISADIYVDAAATGVYYFDVQYYDADGNSVLDGSNSSGTQLGAWTRVFTTDTAPATATQARVRMVAQDATWNILDFKLVKFERLLTTTSLPTPYSNEGDVASSYSAIVSESTARATGDSALSTRIDSLTSTVGDANAAITSEAQTRAAADSALSSRVDSISAEIVIPNMAGSTGDYAGSTQIYAGVYTEISARAEADLALAVKTDTIAAQSQSATSNLTAAVRTETTARVDADSALASQVTTVQANVDANTALIQNEATARADADSAQATQISTVQASVTGLSAAVQTNANSYADLSGKVSASYSIKTQITANGRTYIAGIGVGTDNNGGIIESQVLFSASRVAIIDPNGSAVTAPFVVQGGQVFMSQALIGTGWITNLMIGDIIQSTALGANGQPLWILNKNSGITFNGANIGSGYAVSDNTGGRAYDNNGTLRVRWGVWA